MKTEGSRILQIELLSGKGNLYELKSVFNSKPSQLEIDTALENAIAYSQITTAEYLLGLGGNISSNNHQGVYYSVHNNELEGLKFAIRSGIDINIRHGLLLNTSIVTSINTKSTFLIKWLLNNGADPKLLTESSLQLALKFGSKELNTLLKNAI